MSFSFFSEAGETSISVFNPEETGTLQIHSSHPNYPTVLQICLDQLARGVNEPIDVALFDLEAAISNIFTPLSERVAVLNGELYFDGDVLNSTLSDRIIKSVLDENQDEYEPWVHFLEKLATNPNEHSRESLYEFLRKEDFTITDNGDIVGYKSVWADEDHEFVSDRSNGTAFVDGVIYESQPIPNPIGAIVTMPRSTVRHDPYAGCSAGLHVGTHQYANGFSGDSLLEIHFNPRDVVSVPSDGTVGKVRVSRYLVADYIGPRSYTEDSSPKFEIALRPAVEAKTEIDGHPSPADWTDLVDRAKRQKKGVFALASRQGWILNSEGANPKVRESWTA